MVWLQIGDSERGVRGIRAFIVVHQATNRYGRRRGRPVRRGHWDLVGDQQLGGVALVTTTTSLQTVTTGTITKTVASSGTIEPASQANLNFAVSGRVTAVAISAGQTVTAGQALATLDDHQPGCVAGPSPGPLANDQAQLVTDQADGASALRSHPD